MDQLNVSAPTKDALPKLVTTFESMTSAFTHLIHRTFEVRVDGEWRNAGWSLSARVAGEPEERQDVEYRDARMRAVTLSPAEFRRVVEDALTRQQVSGVPSPDISNTSASTLVMSTDNGFGARPGSVLDISQDTKQSIPFWRRLVSYAQPFHESFVEAYAKWFRVPGWHGSSDGRVGHAFIYVPETRAWFSSLLLEGDALVVAVERGPGYAKKLRLKGAVGTFGTEIPIDLDVVDDRAAITLPLGADTLTLLLVAEDDEVLCWHAETPQYINGGRRALAIAPQEPEAAGILELTRIGECDVIEYKPYVVPADTKFPELLEVVCSFANTRGGTLLVGVDDDGHVAGIERGVRKWAKAPLEEAVERYQALLRKRIGEHIDPRPVIDIRAELVQEHTVLVVRVEPGERRPLTLDGTIYVRFAGTTRKPVGPEIQRMFGTHLDQSPGEAGPFAPPVRLARAKSRRRT